MDNFLGLVGFPIFLVLFRVVSLLYTPSVLLGSFAIFCD